MLNALKGIGYIIVAVLVVAVFAAVGFVVAAVGTAIGWILCGAFAVAVVATLLRACFAKS